MRAATFYETIFQLTSGTYETFHVLYLDLWSTFLILLSNHVCSQNYYAVKTVRIPLPRPFPV